MDWTVISEGIISTVFGTIAASLLTFIGKSIFYKKRITSDSPERRISFFEDVFLMSLFITSFIIVLTFFSFIYNWQVLSGAYLLMASFVMCLVTSWTYKKQCPRCKAVFYGKKLVDKKILLEEKRPYTYRNEIIYLDTDGNIKDRIFKGPEKTKMETCRIEEEFYGCDTCDYRWEKVFDRNLDSANRPKPEIHKTHFKNPNGFS